MDHKAIRAIASEAICPLRPASGWSSAYWASCTRTEAGGGLPTAEAHFVFALLVDLLGFENSGPREKILWSIPVEFDATVFFIEHRKSGLGVFAPKISMAEESTSRVVQLINGGIRSVRESGYFEEWVRKRSKDENVILINDGIMLYDRHLFMLKLFKCKWSEFEQEYIQKRSESLEGIVKSYFSCANLREEAAWLGQAAIDCFFSWTEHIFIHLAILLGNPKVNTVEKCNRLIKSPEWGKKYKAVFDVDNDKKSEIYLSSLTKIRESRNFASHGYFGKHREALWVSTRIGFVPYNVEPGRSKNPWRHNENVGLPEHESLCTIEEFVKYLWSGARQPAYVLLQGTSYPTIFQFMLSGKYGEAMKSEEGMSNLVEGLGKKFDRDENMDFEG